MNAAAWVCLASPLAATIALTLAGTRISRRGAGYVSTLSTMVSFGAAVVALVSMLGDSPNARAHATTSWTWLSAGQYSFGFTLLTDQLSVMMMLIVAGVGSLIIAYSVGYMDGEDEERRFFAYMSLFVFSMLLLVQSGNLLLLLAGWGMVGLSSYLLIGFYQEKESAIAAAKKAFVMNAFGDATMALALFLLIQHTGQLDFAGVFAAAPHGGTVANLIALGLLGGAVAKSAQIPLHTWLPDAMEGPTPVSALIHAATMVTAGVYLIVRTAPLFEDAPKVQDLAAGLGAVTLVMAGLIALVQVDIKRVIAYSTMSQIGYMFVGAGVGAYTASMFHLMTHAFFKALLFLAAGIVIHALSGEQDIRKMGGLARRIPVTFATFAIATAAIAGIPPLAGFFSKDEILWFAFASERGGSPLLWAVGAATAFMTAFYMFRLLWLVFLGSSRMEPEAEHHVHESPVSMTGVLVVLAALSAFGGFISVPHFLEPMLPLPAVVPSLEHYEKTLLVVSVVIALAGLAGAAWVFGRGTARAERVRVRFAGLHRLLAGKYFIDELYDFLITRPLWWISERVFLGIGDRMLLDGSLNGLARLAQRGAGALSRVQSGNLQRYVFFVAIGAIACLAWGFRHG
jgi:NADH-quinone oxidoreductase subunit L